MKKQKKSLYALDCKNPLKEIYTFQGTIGSALHVIELHRKYEDKNFDDKDALIEWKIDRNTRCKEATISLQIKNRFWKKGDLVIVSNDYKFDKITYRTKEDMDDGRFYIDENKILYMRYYKNVVGYVYMDGTLDKAKEVAEMLIKHTRVKRNKHIGIGHYWGNGKHSYHVSYVSGHRRGRTGFRGIVEAGEHVYAIGRREHPLVYNEYSHNGRILI